MLDKSQEKELRRKRRVAKEKKKKKFIKIRPWLEEEEAIKLADHLCNCSCNKCQNPRKSNFHKGKEKLTMQERKFKEDLEEIKNDENI